MNKRMAALILAACALTAALCGCAEQKKTTEAKITTQKVTKGNLLVGMTADGKVSRPTTSLDFAVSGIVKSISVEVGQTVGTGDVLAVLDDTDLKLAVTNAQNALEKANASYNDAVTQRSYNIKSEKIRLDQLYAEYAEAFDDYSYQQNITSANTKLARAISSMNEAQTAVYSAGDAYSQAASAYQSALAQSSASTETSLDADTLASLKKAMDSALSAYNDAVKKLQTQQDSVTDAQTALDNAKRSLASAQETFEKQKATRKQNYDLEKLKYDNMVNSDTSVKTAELNIQDAQNKLEEANNNLDKITLTAPAAGIVISITYKVGELVTGKTNNVRFGDSSDLTAFITLRDPTAVNLTANVTESDITGIAAGQTMRVSVDALSLENLPGRVVSVSSIPQTDSSGIVTYEVIGQLDENDETIKDGMNCFISYVQKEKEGVLLVPVKAVFVEDGKQYVNVQLADNTSEKRAVTCGLSNGVSTEVVSGLKEGETVLIGSAKKS